MTRSVFTTTATSVVLNCAIDHRAVADEAAQPQIALDQRRQLRQHALRIELARAASAASRHSGAAARADAPPAAPGGCSRDRSGRRQRVRIGAVQAGAAEHQVDLVVEHIGGDAAPQQLHGDAAAIGGIDAGAAEFEDAARENS